MKYLSLQQAMLGMRVVLTDTGVLLKSPAGSAEYNHKGRRIKVHGHANYFPDHLRVKDKRSPKGGYLQMSPDNVTVYRTDGTVRLRIGCFDKTPAQSDERLMKCAYHAGVNIGVDDNIKSIMKNAAANAASDCFRHARKELQQSSDGNSVITSTISLGNEPSDETVDDIAAAVRRVLLMECHPGGILDRRYRR